jgi:hypothetical protein
MMERETRAARAGHGSEPLATEVPMRSRLRHHLTYANVMSTLAVFIALGGSSYAAVTLSGSKLKHRSVPGAKLKRNSITNLEVRESRLGRVPRAASADVAGSLIDATESTVRPRQVTAAELRERCPADTYATGGTCIEKVPREPAPYGTAVNRCSFTAPGRRLPTHGELAEVLKVDTVDLVPSTTPGIPTGELTSEVFASTTTPGEVDVLFVIDETGSIAVTSSDFAGRRAFRCAVDPTNR